jgi:hypothetical protein
MPWKWFESFFFFFFEILNVTINTASVISQPHQVVKQGMKCVYTHFSVCIRGVIMVVYRP